MLDHNLASPLLLALLALGLAGCGFMPGGYYYEEIHKHDAGIHDWYWHDGDVNGEVGHRFAHSVLTMDCEPNGNWGMTTTIASGSLPPGLDINSGVGPEIVGIPQERGHWIVGLSVSNVYCNGQSYPAFSGVHEVRFHITGTGKVID